MSTNRDITQVINKIKPLMNQKGVKTFTLDKISSDASYTAPENMSTRWNQLAQFVNESVPMPPKSETDLKIVSIFMGISEDDAKKKFGGFF